MQHVLRSLESLSHPQKKNLMLMGDFYNFYSTLTILRTEKIKLLFMSYAVWIAASMSHNQHTHEAICLVG